MDQTACCGFRTKSPEKRDPEIARGDIMDRQVVVCDGEPHVIRAISLRFTRADFDVKAATDADSCWRLLEAHPLVELLIISDSLPTTADTIELVRRIRGDAQRSRLPIVLLTSKSIDDAKNVEELTCLKFARILPKPFSPRELLATACELLGKESGFAEHVSPTRERGIL
jgi:DNA-binding response OmpR family regulator